MADIPKPRSSSPKASNNKQFGKRNALKKSGHSPKGTESPISRTSGSTSSWAGHGSIPACPVQPLKSRDELGDAMKPGQRSARKMVHSLAKRGDSPLNLPLEEAPQNPGGKTAAHPGASSPRLRMKSGRISPKLQGSPKWEPVRVDSALKSGGPFKMLDEPETMLDEPSPRNGGSPTRISSLEKPLGSPKLGTSINSDGSPKPGRPPKAAGSPTGRSSPAGRGSPSERISPSQRSSPSGRSSPGGRSSPRGWSLPPARRSPGRKGPPVGAESLTGRGMPVSSGGALSADDHARKAEFDAGSTGFEHRSGQPGEAQRQLQPSPKDPRYLYFDRALVNDLGRHQSGSRGGNGRTSPTLRSSGAAVYASDDDATVYERGSSVVRHAAVFRGQKRRSGTSSPASPQRSTIQLSSPAIERLASLMRGEKGRILQSSSPSRSKRWHSPMNSEFASSVIHYGSTRSRTAGSPKPGLKNQQKSSLRVTIGVCVLTVLIAIVLLVSTWRLISIATAPSRMKPAAQHNSNRTRARKAQTADEEGESTHNAYGILLGDAIDMDRRPCDNFYQFACGSWERNRPATSFRIESLRSFVKNALKRMRKETMNGQSAREPIGKATRFVNACLAEGDGTALKDLRAVLAKEGLTWPDRSEGSDFLSVLFFMARRLALPVFFGIDLGRRGRSGHLTLAFAPDATFRLILGRLREHISSPYGAEYIRVTYKSMARDEISESRLSEILQDLHSATALFDLHLRPTKSEEVVTNVTSLVRYAPMLRIENWDAALQKYLRTSTSEINEILIFDVHSFKATFDLIRNRGNAGAKDILGFLAVHAAIFYLNAEIRERFFGSREESLIEQEQHCFGDAYKVFRYAMVDYLLKGAGEALGKIATCASIVGEAFSASLYENTSRPYDASLHSEMSGFGDVFAVLNNSKPQALLNTYQAYPDVSSHAIQNRLALAEHLVRAGMDDKSLVASVHISAERSHDWKKDFSVSYQEFRLTPYHISFPWYSDNVHPAMLYAGVGARLAAALCFEHIKRNFSGHEKMYNYSMCLVKESPSIEATDMEMQAAVAAVSVAYNAFRDSAANTTDLDSPFLTDISKPWMTASRAFFLFSCYLFCGDDNGEAMCNVPLKHNHAFARVFRCHDGSPMNPANKCNMFD